MLNNVYTMKEYCIALFEQATELYSVTRAEFQLVFAVSLPRDETTVRQREFNFLLGVLFKQLFDFRNFRLNCTHPP